MISCCSANGAIAQWLGHHYLGLKGGINPYYLMTAIYIAIFSIGEGFYSPRVYEYAAAIAPKGQEASYGALSYVPFLLGKLLVGAGGWLLAAFCPEHGPRNSGMMWLIFALAASVALAAKPSPPKPAGGMRGPARELGRFYEMLMRGGESILRQSIAIPPDIGPQAERLVREIDIEGYSEVEFRRDSSGVHRRSVWPNRAAAAGLGGFYPSLSGRRQTDRGDVYARDR